MKNRVINRVVFMSVTDIKDSYYCTKFGLFKLWLKYVATVNIILRYIDGGHNKLGSTYSLGFDADKVIDFIYIILRRKERRWKASHN